MAVKKREEIPEIVEVPKPVDELANLKIRVGDKEYPVPHLTLRQYKKMLKLIDDKDIEEMSELGSLEFTQNFYFNLLRADNKDLKKSDLEDMPMYQYSADFIVKVKLSLYRVPLGGEI